LFQVVSRRYEHGSIILTTNRGIASWGEIFDDQTVATAILDRLLHHGTVLAINGPSYRMRRHQARVDQLRAGLQAPENRRLITRAGRSRARRTPHNAPGRTRDPRNRSNARSTPT